MRVWRGQFHAARASVAGGPRATLSLENAAASLLGDSMEGHIASRGGAARLAEPHHGRRHLGHNVCLPDERDLPVRRAVGLGLEEFCRGARRPLVVIRSELNHGEAGDSPEVAEVQRRHFVA